MNWIPLTSENQLDVIDQQSSLPGTKGILIFKHSTRCSISSMSLNRLERSFDLPSDELPVYFLDILNHRSLSEKIASHYNVSHESPQVLIIKNGKCTYTTSHSGISFSEIKSSINS